MPTTKAEAATKAARGLAKLTNKPQFDDPEWWTSCGSAFREVLHTMGILLSPTHDHVPHFHQGMAMAREELGEASNV